MTKTQYLVNEALFDEYIEKSGLMRKFLAEKLGISKQAFHKKRKGKTAFRVSEIFILCYLLHIPEEDRAKIFYPKS